MNADVETRNAVVKTGVYKTQDTGQVHSYGLHSCFTLLLTPCGMAHKVSEGNWKLSTEN